MKINIKWLANEEACSNGVEWFKNRKFTADKDVIEKLMVDDKFQWANWTVVRLMTHAQKIQYAIFAAEQGIEIYEKKYPDDKRPRQAIEAAKTYLKDPSDENKKSANAANAAAYAAAEKRLQKKIIEFGLKILGSH
jgi:hypothetical protein